MKRVLAVVVVLTLLISSALAEETVRFLALDITKDDWVKYFVAYPVAQGIFDPLFINYGVSNYATLYVWNVTDGFLIMLSCEDTTDKVTLMNASMTLDENAGNLVGLLDFIIMINNLIFACNPELSLDEVSTIIDALDYNSVYDTPGEKDGTNYKDIQYYLFNDGKTFGFAIASVYTYNSEEAFLEYRDSTIK